MRIFLSQLDVVIPDENDVTLAFLKHPTVVGEAVKRLAYLIGLPLAVALLAPSCIADDGGGGVYTVPAATDEYLVEEVPVAIDPTPEERAERLIAAVEQDGPMTEEEFADLADSLGLTVRVVRLDGDDLVVTMDFSPTRANVEVADGRVVAVLNFG